ncbi:MAG: alanine racemase [Gemmatimonadetes bacterium]|nr:alanine racemase [Gemmatimonadota bacterium]
MSAASAVETGFAEIETPALLVDGIVLRTNLEGMATLAREAGVSLRPHFKTHKSVKMARRQLELGAIGGTVAKTGEAEVFFAAGLRDLTVATPVVDPRKIRRLLAARGDATLHVLIESEEGLRRWSDAAAAADRGVSVMLEIDTGMGRTGVPWGEAALSLARAIAAAPGLTLGGVLTHAGQGYGAATPEEIARVGREEGERAVATAEILRAAGIACPVVSVGSTPTVAHSARVPGVTEIRPGNYGYLDRTQVALGVAPLERCALTVLATVTARPAADRVVLDCGAKTLSLDDGRGRPGGYGCLVGRPDWKIARLSEEHGILPVPADADLSVGDRVRVVPNHACVTVDLHDEYWIVEGGRIVGRERVDARGRVR